MAPKPDISNVYSDKNILNYIFYLLVNISCNSFRLRVQFSILKILDWRSIIWIISLLNDMDFLIIGSLS